MNTEDLIAGLAADSRAEPPLWPGLMGPLLLGLAGSLLFLLFGLGLRDDLGQALHSPLSVLRLMLTFTLGLLALRLGLALAEPGRLAAGRIAMVALVPLIAAGLWIWTATATPPEALIPAIRGKTIVFCLFFIPLLSIPPTVALLWALRRGASTEPGRTAAAAGLAGGGFAAAIYALHCIEDSPLFYVTWYGTAILIVTLVSARFGPRLLRW